MKSGMPPVAQWSSALALVCFALTIPAWAGEGIWYPKGEVFARLVADPKEPQNFMIVVDLQPFEGADRVSAWLVGIGETFGLYRRPSQRSSRAQRAVPRASAALSSKPR